MLIDDRGQDVASVRYQQVTPFKEGAAAISLNGRWGFIDKDGKTLLSPKYDLAGPPSEGLAVVKVGDKYGYVDLSKRTMAIDARFDKVSPFRNGVAEVVIDGVDWLIDRVGNLLSKATATPTSSMWATFRANEPYSFMVWLIKSSEFSRLYTKSPNDKIWKDLDACLNKTAESLHLEVCKPATASRVARTACGKSVEKEEFHVVFQGLDGSGGCVLPWIFMEGHEVVEVFWDSKSAKCR